MTGWLILATAVLVSGGSRTNEVCFPGAPESVSTGGGHRVLYRWQEDQHVLYFEPKRGDVPVRFMTFEREACVHWSPAGDRFALTIYAGSNVSSVVVFRSNDLSSRTPIATALPDPVLKLLSGSLRGYVEAVTWEFRGLMVRVHGERNGEPAGFDVRVRCTFDGRGAVCVGDR